MDDHRWWGWAGVVALFLIIQAWRALFRMARRPSSGMERLNAAADRILKERGASASNPIPRTKPAGAKTMQAKPERVHHGSGKSRTAAPLPKSSTPAVIRRNGILSGGRE